MDETTGTAGTEGRTGSRRTLLAAGTTAALGAVGVALARPAEAAAGDALLLGRSNSAGGSATSVASGTTGTAFGVTASAGHGLIGIAKLNSKFGILGRNDGATPGPGAAILAEGKTNVGLVSRTGNRDNYGLVALNTSTLAPAPNASFSGALLSDGGRGGAGLVAFSSSPVTNAVPALYAEGTVSGWASWINGDEQVDGGLFALFNLVGTQTPAGVRYREAVSGDAPSHTASGRLTLDATGNAAVTLPQTFRDSAQLSAAAVLLTAMGTGMPNLAATVTATGFTVAGGAANGIVSWQVVAPRHVPGAAIPAAAVRPVGTPGRLAAGRATARPQRVNPALLQG